MPLSLRGSVDGCIFMRHYPCRTPQWTELSMTLTNGLISCTGLVPCDP
jgi:hypothetical protein